MNQGTTSTPTNKNAISPTNKKIGPWNRRQPTVGEAQGEDHFFP